MSNIDRTTDILARLVSFDTTSRNSNLELISYVEAYLGRYGVNSCRVYDETGRKANLFATIGPDDRPGYILSGHTDVVPVDGQDWSADPFKMIEREGRLYGRGTADMKGFLACVLAKVPALVQASPASPLHLAFSYDEEVGCVGVRRLIEKFDSWGMSPRACIVGEPTNMQVVVGHKAKQSFKVEVHGLAAHSSLAPSGVNAIEYAARLISHIQDIGRRLAETGPRDELYDVPFTTAQTNLVQGGSAGNIIPDVCRFTFEFRAIGLDDLETLAEEVRQFAKRVLEVEMRAKFAEAKITIAPKTGYPGLETPADSRIVSLGKKLAQRNDHAKVAYGAEAGLFDQMAGIPSILCGPGSIGQAHKPDEYIEIDELEKCGRFLDRLIEHAVEREV